MASGFSFLRTQFPGLEKTGEFAERYLYSDSNSCLFKLGLLCEDIVNKMFDFDNIAMPYQMKDTLVNKIRLLENEEYITEDLARIMHRLRLGGNEARHEGTDSLQKAKLLLPQAYSLCEWFMQVYGDYTYQPKEYHLPAEQPEAAFAETAKDKAEEARLRKQDNEKAQQAVPLPHKERSQANLQAANRRPKTEAETRCLIDEQLRQVGGILHKAFTGELTKQWRLENGVSDESWEEITWGSFIEKIEAGKNWNALGRPPKNGEFGVVKVSAVTWGEFLEDESKTCTEESQWNEEKRISVGDFLFSRANTIQLVGNCVIVKDVKRKLMLSDKILRFSLSERVYDFFALWYTRTSSYRKQIESVASGNQDGMRNISQNNMKMIIFPLPTLPEQHEIVRLIDDLLARERSAQQATEQALASIDLMKKSILARAFRGELGTNKASEASALELLRQVLAEDRA